MSLSILEIADKLSLKIIGDDSGNAIVSGIGSLESAREDQISFIANPKYLKFLAGTKAKAVIMDFDALKDSFSSPPNFLILDSKNPYLSFAEATRLFYGAPEKNSQAGIEKYADAIHIDKSAIIGENYDFSPGVFVGSGSVIGNNCRILPNTYVGRNVRIGDDVLIYGNVSIYDNSVIGNNCIIHAGTVVGSDGFGYARGKNGFTKIIHSGYAILEDDVELGANVTIDRGVVDYTKIGRGTKIDNLVQVAHNVTIGSNCVIAAQTGIAGSTGIGNNVTIGGQVGIAGHIFIGNNVTIAAQSGVPNDVKDNEIISGTPAFSIKEWRNSAVRFKKLPELFKKVAEIEKLIEQNKNNMKNGKREN